MVSSERNEIYSVLLQKGGQMAKKQNKKAKKEIAKEKVIRVSENMVVVNKKYKDSIFRKLFHQKKELLELYNALNDSYYTNEEELEIVTLDSCLYMSIRNDLAFILDLRLHLYEHQSTPCPNLPLRDLFYVAQEYRGIVDKKSLFSERAVKIPAPRFVVFYNGIEKQPERQMLKLSDLYQPMEIEPMLELQVLVLNINRGNNQWLKDRCKTLREYVQYVERIRYYRNEMKLSLQEAVELSIDDCIREGVLAEFLSRNRMEAVMFSMYEHNEEEEKRKYREAEREYARELGRNEGLELGRNEGLELGRNEGIAMGMEEGKKMIQIEVLHNLMKNMKLTEEEAKTILGI